MNTVLFIVSIWDIGKWKLCEEIETNLATEVQEGENENVINKPTC